MGFSARTSPALRFVTAVVATALIASFANAQESREPRGDFVVTLLGTGVPDPRIDRFGPSTLVQANGQILEFDTGRGAMQFALSDTVTVIQPEDALQD